MSFSSAFIVRTHRHTHAAAIALLVLLKQGVALTGRNRTGPPSAV